MKRIVKRMVSLLLAAAFCLATGNLALAAEELKTAELRTKTTAELMDGIPQARTQAEADAVFAELMARKESGEALRGMIDSYVTANSTTMTSSAVTVNYTVNAIIPSGASLRVGYEYPAIVQTSGSFVSVERTTGTYTKTFNGPFLRCQLRTKFRFVARDYTENKVIRTYTNKRRVRQQRPGRYGRGCRCWKNCSKCWGLRNYVAVSRARIVCDIGNVSGVGAFLAKHI